MSLIMTKCYKVDDIEKIKNYADKDLVIVSTGSQGEPMSALYRMAFAEHDKVLLSDSDLVVISATTIPGNEKLVANVVNELFNAGAEAVSVNDIRIIICQNTIIRTN